MPGPWPGVAAFLSLGISASICCPCRQMGALSRALSPNHLFVWPCPVQLSSPSTLKNLVDSGPGDQGTTDPGTGAPPNLGDSSHGEWRESHWQRGVSSEGHRGSVCDGGGPADQAGTMWKAGREVLLTQWWCGAGDPKGRPQEPWVEVRVLPVRAQWGQVAFSCDVNTPSLLSCFLFSLLFETKCIERLLSLV